VFIFSNKNLIQKHPPLIRYDLRAPWWHLTYIVVDDEKSFSATDVINYYYNLLENLQSTGHHATDEVLLSFIAAALAHLV